MRFDGIWIQRGLRLVRSQERERGRADDEFAADYERLYRLRHFVLLVPGRNYGLDELFFFETAAEASSFYKDDLSDFECFNGDEREPCGFQEVSLYNHWRRVATKACALSTQNKLSGPTEMKRYRTGTKIAQQDGTEE